MIKLGLVGVGKIARDQHLPVIAASAEFELVAAASRNASVEGVRNYASLEAMLTAEPSVDAVTLCTPPGPREADARLALARGLHVLLEKPPAATVAAAHDLVSRANGCALHASWHSRHAPGVTPARDWLHGRRIQSVEIVWKEDIRRWHPGQDWILAPGGMGVFDPGINALSILTEIIPSRINLISAELDIPTNREMPIAARLLAHTSDGAAISAKFDFLQTGDQIWEIAIETDRGVLRLIDGGDRLLIDNNEQVLGTLSRHHEYAGVYQHFATLIREHRVDFDLRPLELVAGAFTFGRRNEKPNFEF
ncbi:Gfo/Idh/MocA family protein [Terricaulis silvestris]|uniref:L-arabinose 1-dehydrogenase n=1 Tax=Terricaulis silvestris TaxID=2686094 RepID=A0A6I6MNI3_9CAUL|nr:Gfo/Idh/MocA family oxidoreductase [Terricaulis silvestris]QGZ96249.1 L-arabinose 1-dehydrogenase [Terricaulis silvestris]